MQGKEELYLHLVNIHLSGEHSDLLKEANRVFFKLDYTSVNLHEELFNSPNQLYRLFAEELY